jgi:membrane-associated phospholipid phosphatase
MASRGGTAFEASRLTAVTVLAGSAEPLEPVPPSTPEPSASGRGLRPWLAEHRPTRRAAIGWTVYGLLLALYISQYGIPFTEDTLLVWVTGAVFVACLSDLGRFRRGFLRDWLPLYLVLGIYALLRGYADHLLFPAHITPQLNFDEWISAGIAPTVRLQRWLFDPHHLRVWDYIAFGTYLSHFFLSYLIAGVLWIRNHTAFRRFMTMYVTLMLTGFLTYVLYPAMPPWLASQDGYMQASTRVVPVVWGSLGLHWAAALFESGSKFNNDVAAVPSLHAACPMLICLFFFPRVRKTWLKVLLVAYVPMMALALVYTGEHFVFDIILGWIYAIVVYFGVGWVMDRLDQRRRDREEALGAPALAAGAEVGRADDDTGAPVPVAASAATRDRVATSAALDEEIVSLDPETIPVE